MNPQLNPQLNAHKATYRCPICLLDLTSSEQGFCCTDNHQFDRAKEGYVNLLPVQHKSSKVPGDSKEMVLARREFLATNAYEFLQQALIKQIGELLANETQTANVIDVGCGEGYYTDALSKAAANSHFYGIDIAKAAIRYAAKRYKSVDFAVASHLKLPFASNFASVICKIFAPVTLSEVTRILKPGGSFVTVVPGANHLFELKQVIYDFPKPHEPEPCPEGFTLVKTQTLSRKVTLTDPAQIANLSQMTPFAWKITEQKKQQLIDAANFEVTFDFVINVYQG